MTETRQVLDTAKLSAAITERAAELDLSMRGVCAQARVSPNVTTRLANEPGYVPNANVLLALLLWLGPDRTADLSRFAAQRDIPAGGA